MKFLSAILLSGRGVLRSTSLLCWCSLFLASSTLLQATISESITNYTGYVIASDASNGGTGYNRDAIRVLTHVQYASILTESEQYRIEFRLLDADDNPVSIINHAGQTSTVYYLYDNVSVTSFINKTLIYNAPLVPTDTLDAGSTHTAEVRLSSNKNALPGIYIFSGDVRGIRSKRCPWSAGRGG